MSQNGTEAKNNCSVGLWLVAGIVCFAVSYPLLKTSLQTPRNSQIIEEIAHRSFISLPVDIDNPEGHMRLFQSYGYKEGTTISSGDFSILMKALDFTNTCLNKGWITPNSDQMNASVTIIDPTKASDLFLETFSEAEIHLLMHELNSNKENDIERDNLLKKAGYSIGGKIQFTGKGFPADSRQRSGSGKDQGHVLNINYRHSGF